jgi:hypothetical protein
MLTTMFSRSACIDNLFVSLAKTGESNTDLSKQLVKLYNIYFPDQTDSEDDGTLSSEDEIEEIINSPLQVQKTRVSVKGGKFLKDEEEKSPAKLIKSDRKVKFI